MPTRGDKRPTCAKKKHARLIGHKMRRASAKPRWCLCFLLLLASAQQRISKFEVHRFLGAEETACPSTVAAKLRRALELFVHSKSELRFIDTAKAISQVQQAIAIIDGISNRCLTSAAQAHFRCSANLFLAEEHVFARDFPVSLSAKLIIQACLRDVARCRKQSKRVKQC